ncbi:MAG: tetratricopeptide repeat protein [Terriglobales bacterium]
MEREYNESSPHRSLGQRTPSEFAYQIALKSDLQAHKVLETRLERVTRKGDRSTRILSYAQTNESGEQVRIPLVVTTVNDRSKCIPNRGRQRSESVAFVAESNRQPTKRLEMNTVKNVFANVTQRIPRQIRRCNNSCVPWLEKKLFASSLILVSLICACVVSMAARQNGESELAASIRAKLEAGQFDSAVSESRSAVARYPASFAIYQLLGSALFKKGEKEESRSAFQRAIQLAPSASVNYFNLARVDLSLNRLPEAVTSLETFLRFEPRDAAAHVLLGRAYHNLNQTLPGIEQFKAALAIDPTLPLAHFHLGYAELALGDRATAMAEFEAEIKVNPDFADPYWMMGNIEFDRGNLDAAETLFVRAIARKAESFSAHYGLARVLARMGKGLEAEAEFRKALADEPNRVEAHYALARLYRQMGRAEDANREFGIVAAIHASGHE